jgi:hypothetical protein
MLVLSGDDLKVEDPLIGQLSQEGPREMRKREFLMG